MEYLRFVAASRRIHKQKILDIEELVMKLGPTLRLRAGGAGGEVVLKAVDTIPFPYRNLRASCRLPRGYLHHCHLHHHNRIRGVEAEMADAAKKNKQDMLIERNDAKDENKGAAEKIPSPPEKPLPGDCCGSGCVRCVWDVYYEELEDYNNRYRNDSQEKSESKSN
ncbi:PREDICTED: uncharacterized protein LOC104602013 [Nelumbo nucifera]|uniref:Oxidoreductase-like domain-containing protein n=2 Tax=Nelumbo nucifera TaxID=4432 RepID=A0A822ZU96_NELNU|nr:PREDICTED: uncharacterized protein LOC104602013 [Nelumbo nucifera]DAD46915.1 TPA_asm: hypothetical protein HUJ06_016852 [Nelumbo nucifera]